MTSLMVISLASSWGGGDYNLIKRLARKIGWALQGTPWRYDNTTEKPWRYRLGVRIYQWGDK